MDEWIKKMRIYIQWNNIQPLKGKEILSFAATWVKLEGIMLSEISQTEIDKFCRISSLCGIEKKKQSSNS